MTAKLISNIRIDKLFGLYTYTIPEFGDLTNAAILYGDNGVGKSTLLRLVFHLLSAADNRGHRTALYQTDFQRLEVTLSSGAKLVARILESSPSKVLLLEVISGEKRIAIWDYSPRDEHRYVEEGSVSIEVDSGGNTVFRRRVTTAQKKELGGAPRGEKAYLDALKAHVPALFILNADRRLDSDAVADPSDEVELRRTMQYGEPKRINELVARSREIALSQALGASARWISRKAVQSTNRGSMNVHFVYGDVLKRLVARNKLSAKATAAVAVSIPDLLRQLSIIDMKSAEHAQYELATHLPTAEFRKTIGGRKTAKTLLAAELLQPYVKSVEGRLEAVEPIYQLIDRFIKIVNGLLTDKSIDFKLSQGFTIRNRLGLTLKPAQLSSGEQQLLLLFCYVLTARDTSTIFMIDEPEISLNVKWQRQLVQSLLEITEGASIQFILASHSMELLAQHRNRVVKLSNKL
jgi:energy-coupling factor transporter ATP-binding protein EcfA2